MGFDAPTTIGVHVGEGEEERMVENFDRHFSNRRGAEYRRSGTIKDAMAFYLAVDEVLAGLDFELESERDKQMFIRQAIYDRARAERDAE